MLGLSGVYNTVGLAPVTCRRNNVSKNHRGRAERKAKGYNNAEFFRVITIRTPEIRPDRQGAARVLGTIRLFYLVLADNLPASCYKGGIPSM